MKILISNNHLFNYGGSETACYTLGVELRRRGHVVRYYTPQDGRVGYRLRRAGVMPHTPGEVYDLKLLSHRPTVTAMRNVPGYTVQICHGAIPALEQPEPGADKYVAISEEVQLHLAQRGFESVVIPNGVDLRRFLPTKPRTYNKSKPAVLCLSQSAIGQDMAARAAQLAGASFAGLNKFVGGGKWEVEELMNRASVVITLGRGAYEAMACNRPVIVWDARDYMGGRSRGDGLLTPENVEHSRRFNCSGRWLSKEFTVQELAREIEAALKAPAWERAYALVNFSITDAAEQYLNLIP